MNHQQARSLITETFTQAFDANRFLAFTGNLLNNIDRYKAFICNSQIVQTPIAQFTSPQFPLTWTHYVRLLEAP